MRAPPTPAKTTAAERLRLAIEAAEADGVLRETMLLRLTHGDVAQLKRDSTLAMADISFKDGVMRYLGVAIRAGGVADSALERSDAN